MGWVRRTTTEQAHWCTPPVREIVFAPPGSTVARWPEEAPPPKQMRAVPDGHDGDLWRCECGRLWRVGEPERPVGGYSDRSLEWLPATWWQRWRHRS